MIRPEPRAPTRDDLAQQVSWLPWGTFRGSGAKTANEVLDVAKGMEREGATPHEIHDETAKFAGPEETGMMQNPAKQWGYNLSDKGAMLTPQALDWMKAKFSTGYGNETPEVGLERLWQHDSLYDRVPGLKEVKTTLEQPETGSSTKPGGGYDAPNTNHGQGTTMGRIFAIGDPKIDPNANDPWSLRSTLTHEVQHAIQNKYNLPVGGYEGDKTMQAIFNEKMQPQVNDLRIKFETDREKYAMDYAQAMGGGEDMLRKGREQWQREFPDKNILIAQSNYVGGKPGNSREGITSTPPLRPFEQYKSLAGEQYADRAAAQMDWGTEQLRANPIFEANGGRFFNSDMQLSPAMQMIRWGPGQFDVPDPLWAAINTAGKR